MVYESETIQYSLPVDLYSKDSPILFGSAVLKRREDGEAPFVIMMIRNVSEQLIEDMKLELLLEQQHGVELQICLGRRHSVPNGSQPR